MISDFFHLRLGGGGGDNYSLKGVYSLKVFIVFVAAFPTGPSVCWGGGGGGGGGSTGF